MYITITPQKLGGKYSQSSADFVDYLEKENEELEQEDHEHFFNQYEDVIDAKEVVREIDGNTAKLEKTEPRFYSITVSPSKYELNRMQNHSEDLKKYTRELMKDYVASFNREINGKPVNIDDIKYYAKIEHSGLLRERINRFGKINLLPPKYFSSKMKSEILKTAPVKEPSRTWNGKSLNWKKKLHIGRKENGSYRECKRKEARATSILS